MYDLQQTATEMISIFSLLLFAISVLVVSITTRLLIFKPKPSPATPGPKSYPIIGSALAVIANANRLADYVWELLRESPTQTVYMELPIGVPPLIATANPANVKHILRDRFEAYPKGNLTFIFRDFLGEGIFNVDGAAWKVQRKIASHEFNTRSLRKFVDSVVYSEVMDRLIPLLSASAADARTLDFQDVLQRFAINNICSIAFGSDQCCSLDPSIPPSEFAKAFDDVVNLISLRLRSPSPLIWQFKKVLNIGSEQGVRHSLRIINTFAATLIHNKRNKLGATNLDDHDQDLLSRFINQEGATDEFVRDMIVSFVLAGRDTTSSALTWFFWLLSCNKHVEDEIIEEITRRKDVVGFEEVKEMHYLHAAICESMRLYPPVAFDTKDATEDDVLPDGTVVTKGSNVMYHPYAMGRMEILWGKDWPEFRPERWLEKIELEEGRYDCEEKIMKWRFMAEDPFKFPVFQAGPRVCLGKEFAFVQMKSVVAAVIRRFRVVPTRADLKPVYVAGITSRMEGGFHVKIIERIA